MFFNCLTVLCLVALTLSAPDKTPEKPAPQYPGRLEPELAASHHRFWLRNLTAAEPGLDLPVPLAAADRAFIGTLGMAYLPHSARIAMVEPGGGMPYVYVDTNLDDAFGENERYSFSTLRDPADEPGVKAEYETTAKVTLSDGPFKSYPIRLLLDKSARTSEGKHMLLESDGVVVRGTAVVDGQPVLVEYRYSPRVGELVPDDWQGMDCDGDGRIDTKGASFLTPLEWTRVKGRRPVFRVGSHHLSTSEVDLGSGRFTLKSHPATDYQRIEIQVGTDFPDIRFTGFDGKPGKLSDFSGKYLLLDFWGSWCGPCIAEFRDLKTVRDRYRPLGFEILGMDYEHIEEVGDAKVGMARAQRIIDENAATWPQATFESIKDLVEVRLAIREFPTKILLDPRRRVLSWGKVSKDQLPLNGKALPATLDRLLADPR